MTVWRAGCTDTAGRDARSRGEFVARLGLVLTESDETVFWTDYLTKDRSTSGDLTTALAEARELAAIFGASYRTARARYLASKSAKSSKSDPKPLS